MEVQHQDNDYSFDENPSNNNIDDDEYQSIQQKMQQQQQYMQQNPQYSHKLKQDYEATMKARNKKFRYLTAGIMLFVFLIIVLMAFVLYKARSANFASGDKPADDGAKGPGSSNVPGSG